MILIITKKGNKIERELKKNPIKFERPVGVLNNVNIYESSDHPDLNVPLMPIVECAGGACRS